MFIEWTLIHNKKYNKILECETHKADTHTDRRSNRKGTRQNRMGDIKPKRRFEGRRTKHRKRSDGRMKWDTIQYNTATHNKSPIKIATKNLKHFSTVFIFSWLPCIRSKIHEIESCFIRDLYNVVRSEVVSGCLSKIFIWREGSWSHPNRKDIGLKQCLNVDLHSQLLYWGVLEI